tara:strand:+ start:7732 stop:8025 length:294 start_codon:yes stop_codon:yes gene_type:complete
MNKIILKIIRLQTKLTPKADKLAHFFWGFFYALLGLIIDETSGTNVFVFLLPAIAGSYKEIKDIEDKAGTAEFKDFLFTILPGLTLIILKAILWQHQ